MKTRSLFITAALLAACSDAPDAALYPASNGYERNNLFHIEFGSIRLPIDVERTEIHGERIDGIFVITVETDICDGTTFKVHRGTPSHISYYVNEGYEQISPNVYRLDSLHYLTPTALHADETYMGPIYHLAVTTTDEACITKEMRDVQTLRTYLQSRPPPPPGPIRID